jgi:hypothetical protein
VVGLPFISIQRICERLHALDRSVWIVGANWSRDENISRSCRWCQELWYIVAMPSTMSVSDPTRVGDVTCIPFNVVPPTICYQVIPTVNQLFDRQNHGRHAQLPQQQRMSPFCVPLLGETRAKPPASGSPAMGWVKAMSWDNKRPYPCSVEWSNEELVTFRH